ncbi:cytochrome c oxidase subunit 7A2, mitochondrial-like [Rhineura floridana]|uniref:cytochrome c oxidase subunit 7A2, mitochondrial-like n=1 Tax=Rhineura floridana TaxID=261503 RepID=UPI002AC87FF1|nr:cytochrome c oxidase subunit 7A2, mitochondrial-like [Rhineura floridana]
MKSLLTSRIGSLRFFSTSTTQQMKNRVPEYQKLFQEDNGLPVHLKGGTTDALMYRLSMSLSIFGVAYCVFELYRAANPKKKSE